jgi:hypothetical protein
VKGAGKKLPGWAVKLLMVAEEVAMEEAAMVAVLPVDAEADK